MPELYPPTLEEYNNIEYIPKEKLIFCKEIYKLIFNKCLEELKSKNKSF